MNITDADREAAESTPEEMRAMADRLEFIASTGDFGRKPDPDCTLRQAAAMLRAIAEQQEEWVEVERLKLGSQAWIDEQKARNTAARKAVDDMPMGKQ